MFKFKNIETQEVLQKFVAENLRGGSRMAMDTEFMREKTYFSLLCLIQVKIGCYIYCIDVLNIDDLSCLGEIFESPDVTIIFHAARQDLEALKTRIETNISSAEDTQIAAAFCGYGDNVGYAGLVKGICGVSLEKSYTRTNWAARPLSEKQWQYAVEDVDYLLPVADYLKNQLITEGKISWYQNECRQLSQYNSYVPNPEDAWKRLKGGEKIPVKGQHIAKSLCEWRERTAQKKNLPREWVLSSKNLITLSIHSPKDMHALSMIEKLPPNLIFKRGELLLSIIQQAQKNTDLLLLWKKREILNPHQKRMCREIVGRLQKLADEINISPSLLSNRKDIEQMILGNHDISLLHGWRRELIGSQLLEQYW